jgi:NAD(P) transhydrogenase
LEGDVFLIATGSDPFHPPVLPFDDPRIYDSDTILDIHDLPRTMLIAGGGVIGCEYACMFAALGIDVHLVEGRDRLLTFMDTELIGTLTRCMGAMDVEMHMPDVIEEVDAGADRFIHTCYNYPTLTEIYKYATYDALGQRARRLASRGAGAAT